MKPHLVSLVSIGHNIQMFRPGHGFSLTQHKCRFSTYSHGRYDQMTWHNGDDQVSRWVFLHGPTKLPKRNGVSATSPKINMFLKRDHFKRNIVFQLACFQYFFRGYQGSKGSCQQKYMSPSYTGLSFASIFWSVAWWSNNDNPPPQRSAAFLMRNKWHPTNANKRRSNIDSEHRVSFQCCHVNTYIYILITSMMHLTCLQHM